MAEEFGIFIYTIVKIGEVYKVETVKQLVVQELLNPLELSKVALCLIAFDQEGSV